MCLLYEYMNVLSYIHILQGLALEDATGLAINGDVDVHSIYAASLPTSYPSFAPRLDLELLPQWKAPPILGGNVELFIGILSAGGHFAERMAVRKSWMQHKLIKSSHVVARFFVALVRVAVSYLRSPNCFDLTIFFLFLYDDSMEGTI
jgi:hypothetical protein